MDAPMIIRHLHPDDVPTLRAMYVAQGFAYEFPDLTGPLMEAVLVVVDENGKILAAVAAERLAQLYFLCGDMEHPAAKLSVIRSLHTHMADALRVKGYHSADAFLPPPIAETFGKRLERTFNWTRNWQSWTKGF
jgi:hypothetical protein